ncbi:hypothetical protein J5N97_019696 [Dioscorea zingiberensis]|uniref:Uncharacterized protein n=1 Tax=Dioscorea zingiberensis TaxID=325984 RepID=A0A9D5CEB9_9LILI|nr:hypothetical protein J5N97_019696 [Dioscorea zingiberensis]
MMKVSIGMAKDVDRGFNHPLPGGLSLLSMDFSSKGFSWADNIYQKWGNICLDNILSQKPCKYVGVFGEHFRRMLDEVADDWLNHSDDCVEGPVSDLSLEHNVISEVCKKSTLVFDDLNASTKGLSHTTQSVEALNCKALQGQDQINEELTSSSDENVSSYCSDGVSALGHLTGARTTECLDGLSREEEDVTQDVVELNMESMEEFENVNFKDIWEDIETSKLVSISQPACKQVSYKRKFRHVFYSKLRSAKKDKGQIEPCLINNDMKQDVSENASPEISSQVSFEADWEIL